MESSNDIEYLKNIFQKSRWYYILHLNTSQYYLKINHCIHLPLIFVNIASSVFIVNIESENDIIRFISAIIILLNSLVTSLTRQFKIEEKLTFHKSLSIQYLQLSNDIEEYLVLSDDEPTSNKIYKEYLKLSLDNEYDIPKFIIDKGMKELSNNGKELYLHIKYENNHFLEKPPEIRKLKEKIKHKPFIKFSQKASVEPIKNNINELIEKINVSRNSSPNISNKSNKSDNSDKSSLNISSSNKTVS